VKTPFASVFPDWGVKTAPVPVADRDTRRFAIVLLSLSRTTIVSASVLEPSAMVDVGEAENDDASSFGTPGVNVTATVFGNGPAIAVTVLVPATADLRVVTTTPLAFVVPPDGLKSERERVTQFAHLLPPPMREGALAERPFELRVIGEGDDPFHPVKSEPRRQVWLRATGELPADPALHAYLLAYASDHSFVTTALLPHGETWLSRKMQVASLDHVMWFHQPFRVDDWMLYAMDSPAAHGGRGLVRGQVFSRDGRLVASTSQEGLIRRRSI